MLLDKNSELTGLNPCCEIMLQKYLMFSHPFVKSSVGELHSFLTHCEQRKKKTWLKNYDDPMHPYRVAVMVKFIKNVYVSTFLEP